MTRVGRVPAEPFLFARLSPTRGPEDASGARRLRAFRIRYRVFSSLLSPHVRPIFASLRASSSRPRLAEYRIYCKILIILADTTDRQDTPDAETPFARHGTGRDISRSLRRVAASMEKITWNPEGARRSERSNQLLNRPIALTPDSNIRAPQ